MGEAVQSAPLKQPGNIFRTGVVPFYYKSEPPENIRDCVITKNASNAKIEGYMWWKIDLLATSS